MEPWVNSHDADCPVTAGRVALIKQLALTPDDPALLGAKIEYDLGGDQEVELCVCSRSWSFGGRPGEDDDDDMSLMVCIDGAEAASVPLKDGDDPFNAEAERGALDRAYEFKDQYPDSVVSIVLAGWPEPEEREYLIVRYDVTELDEEQRSGLALEAQVQAEESEHHAGVAVEIEWQEREQPAPATPEFWRQVAEHAREEA